MSDFIRTFALTFAFICAAIVVYLLVAWAAINLFIWIWIGN